VDLEFGDEIGVFTSSELCVGAIVYSGSYPLGLAAWVDNSQTPEVDGYIAGAGDLMVFKIWDKSENKEIDAVASYIRGNGTFEDEVNAVISTLTGIAKKAQILLGTTSLEFGDVIVNSMSSLNLVIKNEGDKVLVITDIVSSSNLFTVSKSEFEVGINDSDNVEVVFKPLDAGSFSGSLTIYSNDYDNPVTVVSASGNGIPSQTIGLGQGWNWISFNVEPSDLSVENVFASTHNLDIVKNNEGQFYIPGLFDNIGTIDITQGYIVHLSAVDQVYVTGTQVDISTSISLANGWNLISYIPTFSLTPEEAFSSISTNLAICKNDDGNFYIPGVFNNMTYLTAGEAYQLYLSSSTEFVYPSVLSKQVYKNRISANSLNKFKGGHFTYRSKTGDFYPVLIEVKENQLEIGDEVGVFINNGNGEICVGSSVFNGNSPLGISVWKDDAETDEKDGYREQDNITFKVWKTKENKEIQMPSIFSPGSNLIDPSLPYLMVSDLISVEEEDNYLITNYPNPFNPVTTIRFFLPNPAETTIEIYNVLGEKIKTIVNEYKLSGFYEVEWDGKNEYEGNVSSGVYLCRLKQGKDVLVKKLTVLR